MGGGTHVSSGGAHSYGMSRFFGSRAGPSPATHRVARAASCVRSRSRSRSVSLARGRSRSRARFRPAQRRRMKTISKLVRRWVKKCKRLTSRVNQGLKGYLRHPTHPVDIGSGATLRRDYALFDIGYRRWNEVGASINVASGHYNQANSKSPNRNLLYLTPCVEEGVDEFEREGDDIRWKRTRVQFRLRLSENAVQANSFWTALRLRFITFKFMAEGPIQWKEGVTTPLFPHEQYPQMEDLFDKPYLVFNTTGTRLVEGALGTTMTTERVRKQDYVGKCVIVKNQLIKFNPNTNTATNKALDFNYEFRPKKGGVNISYTKGIAKGVIGHTAPIKQHYFLALIHDRPMKLTNEDEPVTRLEYNIKMSHYYDK